MCQDVCRIAQVAGHRLQKSMSICVQRMRKQPTRMPTVVEVDQIHQRICPTTWSGLMFAECKLHAFACALLFLRKPLHVNTLFINLKPACFVSADADADTVLNKTKAHRNDVPHECRIARSSGGGPNTTALEGHRQGKTNVRLC